MGEGTEEANKGQISASWEAPGVEVGPSGNMSLTEFINLDPRPTLVADISRRPGKRNGQFHVAAANESLRCNPELSSILGLEGTSRDALPSWFSWEEMVRFETWLFQVPGADNETAKFFGYEWVSFTMGTAFRILSGKAIKAREDRLRSTAASGGFGNLPSEPANRLHQHSAKQVSLNSPELVDSENASPDPTPTLHQAPARSVRTLPPSEHVQFALDYDWTRTPLGPMALWPADLAVLFDLVLHNPRPALLFWGQERTCICNKPIASVVARSPLGLPLNKALASFPESLSADLQTVSSTGKSAERHTQRHIVARLGHAQEFYLTWTMIPVFDNSGSVMGVHVLIDDVTPLQVQARRLLTLKDLSERLMGADALPDFYSQIIQGLESNELDVPFALLYTVQGSNAADDSTHGQICTLQGSLGVPIGHEAAQPAFDLTSPSDGFGQYLCEATQLTGPTYFSVDEGTLNESLVKDFNLRGFKDPCQAMVVVPIRGSSEGSPLAFLIIGIRSRPSDDQGLRSFFGMLNKQIHKWLQYTIMSEEKLQRDHQAQKELSAQLAARLEEIHLGETRFATVATYAPVGIFIADGNGNLTFFNEKWYEISGHPKDGKAAETWAQYVHEEDLEALTNAWSGTTEKHVPSTMQFRFKRPWVAPDGSQGSTWVLGASYPEKGPDGTLLSIFGCLTDISEQKWAESLQTNRMEEALELKRQQEYFIDITSHEMRNPLSAILQCADAIIGSLTAYERKFGMSDISRNNIEAAQTILLCAQHQKYIVDDVLTLSKINSAILLVTPVDVEPLTIVERIMRIYKLEAETKGIALELRVLKSYTELGITSVKLDPSRLTQILINLITNAIKFTDSSTQKKVTLSIGAALESPSKQPDVKFEYFPTRSNRIDLAEKHEWGTGDIVYLQFSVKDTGRGMSETEKKLLFTRFSQASPRTHVQYGGSGLGLFISRELTELHNGEIGVESEVGKGSNFSFYLKTRRSSGRRDSGPDYFFPGPSNSLTTSTSLTQATSAVASADKSLGNAGKGLSVLLVEDNLVNQRVLEKQLKDQGLTVHVANHGLDALRSLEDFDVWRDKGADGLPLSVMLMDIEMPVMDGLACARRIRELQQQRQILRHVPIIAVTGNARIEHVKAAMDAGMDAVISKPFRVRDLIPKIEELARGTKPPTLRNNSTAIINRDGS